MAENVSCKYLLGICYICQKCLYCFNFLHQNSCECKKNIQPSRIKNPQCGQQIYQRVFASDPFFPKSNKYLFDANTRFGYYSNFEEPFSYTFCSKCNSQMQRFRNADKKAQQVQQAQQAQIDNEMNALDNSSNEEEVGVDDKNNGKKEDQIFLVSSADEEEDDDIIEEDDEDSDLEEVKVQIIVKSKDIKAPTAKTITIEPVNYKKIMEKINSIVQKTLGKQIKSKNYVISYKAINARGPSNELEDESDFQEFIGEYKRVVLSGKKMSMIVAMRDNVIKKKNSTNKHKKVKFFYIL